MPKAAEVALRRGKEEAEAPFPIGCAELKKLYESGKDEENRAALAALGGAAGLCEKLRSHPENGIPAADDLERRRDAFGENRTPEPPFTPWLTLFMDCFGDEVLLILIAAAVVSVIINSIPAISDHPETGWIDGVAILLAVLIVATVTATNDYNKQVQFAALSAASKAREEVQVLRDGKLVALGPTELCVGDVVHLETGAKIPADGIVLRCSDFKTNESAVTGESDEVKKDPIKAPILLSGTQVTAGTADFVVTAVGVRSLAGSIMADVAQEGTDTPLQIKLDLLARHIGYVGMLCAAGTFIAMMIIKATGATPEPWGQWTVKSFIYGITIIVVAIPEGLPLAVTISLAYSTRQMLADNNLIRHLDACETMGSATDICSDKTGTLTENRMTVVAAWVGGKVYDLPNASDEVTSAEASSTWATLPPALRSTLTTHLAVNSTANIFSSAPAPEGKGALAAAAAAASKRREIKGSKTEGAGLLLVEACGFELQGVRKSVRVLKQYAFSSDKKMMTTLVQNEDGSITQFTTGGSDFVLARCSAMLKADAGAGAGEKASTVPLTAADKEALIADVINNFARQTLRTLGVATRTWASISALPSDWETTAPDGDSAGEGLALYTILGIKDPLRKDVKQAVADCQRAGVMVRMCTGDNIITATAIARECGILREGDVVLEGPNFRRLTPSQLDELLPHLSVVARCSPRDKNWLVRRLNGNLPATREEWETEHPGASWETERHTLLPGYAEEWAAVRKHPKTGKSYKAVVGVTGDGTNDAPALKAADVGLAMGIAGTDVAKDAADIVILDDRFASIARSVVWGRSVYENVQKFLQFQLTVNVVALVLTFLSACLQQEPPLNPVMMLWVNLIMDTMGALALATEKPSDALLDRAPFSMTASLLTPMMWRHILMQSLLQLCVTLSLVVHGANGLGITPQFLKDNGKYLTKNSSDPVDEEDVGIYRSTFIFNAFVWAQIFNEINARSIGTSWTNSFRGLLKSKILVVVLIISAGLQAFFVEIGGSFVKTCGLTATHWGYTIALGALALPMGVLMRYIPVPSRPSDFANYYSSWFRSAMDARRAATSGSTSPVADGKVAVAVAAPAPAEASA